ncbi:MAG: ester cyclase [Acidobacteriota bacterium]
MTESERNLGHRWFEQVWNQGRREAIAEMLAPGGVIHEGPQDAVGPEGFYPFFDRMVATFSEVHVTVEDTLAQDDRLCIRWTFQATHTGDGLGLPASGKRVHITGITLVRIKDGKMVEAWQNWDMLGLMHQVEGARKSATYISQ